MILIEKYVAYSAMAAMMVLLLIPMARATAESFTVRAGQEEIRHLTLAAEDHVQIRFVVTGQAANALSFYITEPDGNVFANFGDTGNLNYAFVCPKKGEYTLHFYSAASTEDTLVSLDCEIQHYILGMPQMLFLTLIVVGLCVAAVAIFILMSKHA
jgi:multisubunit Na+/H+ antiporter MnhC subunit